MSFIFFLGIMLSAKISLQARRSRRGERETSGAKERAKKTAGSSGRGRRRRRSAPLSSLAAPRCFKKEERTPAPFFIPSFQHSRSTLPSRRFRRAHTRVKIEKTAQARNAVKSRGLGMLVQREPGVAISSFAEGLAFFFPGLPWCFSRLSLLSLKRDPKATSPYLPAPPGQTAWAAVPRPAATSRRRRWSGR